MHRLALAGIAVGVTVLCTPFGCGGDAFTAGPQDAGGVADVTAGDDAGPPGDATPDARRRDGSADGSTDGSSPPPLEAGGAVMGNVIDVFGRPVAGATVRSGPSNAATTDGQGAFVLQGISPPYDIIVGHKAKDGSPRGYAFLGLTRPDPTLQLALEDVVGSPSAATVTGVLPVNEVNDAESLVFVDLPAGAWPVATNTAAYTTSVSTFSVPPSWEGPPQVNAETYLLQWSNDTTSGLPSSYQVATGTMSPLTAGQATPVTFATGFSIQTADISSSIGVAAGYTLVDTALYVRPSNAIIAAPIVHTPMAATNLAVPEWPGATYVLCAKQQLNGQDASASAPYGRACTAGLSPGSSNVTIAPPTATTLIAPPSMIGVASQVGWNPLPVGGVYAVILEAPAPNPTILIVTAGTSVKVPDLAGVGASLPSGQSYTMTVIGLAPFASMDDAAGPSGYDAIVVASDFDHGPASDGLMASSGPVTVTAR